MHYEPRGDRPIAQRASRRDYFLPLFVVFVALVAFEAEDLLVALLAVFFAGILFTSSGA
jgi:hypothetical protein